MKLPNAENAMVEIQKLRDYCLNPNHEEGKHKARQFREKLGITSDDAEQLRQVILDAILKVEATEHEPSQHGRRFTVDLEVSWPEGKIILSTALVRTAWIIRNDEDFPRLTTCFTPRRSA
jgi:Domain of unknown function (DUF6883)